MASRKDRSSAQHPNVCVPAGAWPEKHSGEKHSGVDGHALVGVSKANALNRSAANVGAAYEDAAAYRLAHPLKGPKDDKGIRHRKACAAFGWKQPMHVLVPSYQPHAHARATIDRDAFAAWVRARRVRLIFLKRTGLAWWMSLAKKHDAEATFDYQKLARFLGRPIPASREIPRFKHNRCSVDGVLRGPWSSATDRDKIRVMNASMSAKPARYVKASFKFRAVL